MIDVCTDAASLGHFVEAQIDREGVFPNGCRLSGNQEFVQEIRIGAVQYHGWIQEIQRQFQERHGEKSVVGDGQGQRFLVPDIFLAIAIKEEVQKRNQAKQALEEVEEGAKVEGLRGLESAKEQQQGKDTTHGWLVVEGSLEVDPTNFTSEKCRIKLWRKSSRAQQRSIVGALIDLTALSFLILALTGPFWEEGAATRRFQVDCWHPFRLDSDIFFVLTLTGRVRWSAGRERPCDEKQRLRRARAQCEPAVFSRKGERPGPFHLPVRHGKEVLVNVLHQVDVYTGAIQKL